MPHQTYGGGGAGSHGRGNDLATLGHIIDIRIEAVGSSFAGLEAKGLIDTGASTVCVSQRIADRLELRQIDENALGVVGGGTVSAKIYMGYLIVPELQFRELTRLYAVNMPFGSHNVLLGRSFLRNFIVTFNGPEGIFHFARPGGLTDPIGDDFAT